jgi:hypothetical protein
MSTADTALVTTPLEVQQTLDKLTLIIADHVQRAHDLSVGLATLEIAAKQIQSGELRAVDDATANQVVEIRNTAGRLQMRLEGHWNMLIEPVNALHKTLTKLRGEFSEPFGAVKKIANTEGERYLRELAMAKKHADEELAKLAVQQKKELLKQADEKMGQGFIDDAERIRRQALATVAPSVPSNLPNLAGARVTPKLVGKVTDLMAFLRGIVEGTVPLMHQSGKPPRDMQIVEVNEAVLRSAVSRQGTAIKWPGVEIADELKLGARKL